MKKEILTSIRNYIKDHNIVDYDEENEVFKIDTFDILNADNHPVLTDNVTIKEEDGKIEIDFTSNEKKNFYVHWQYDKDDMPDIEKLYNDIYEEIVFLNFFGKDRGEYLRENTPRLIIER